MEREYNVKKSETEKHLHYAVLDNMILSYTGVGIKGSKTGVEYEGFRIPDQDEMTIVSTLQMCIVTRKPVGSSVVECLTQDRGVADLSLTGGTVNPGRPVLI